MSKKDTLVWLDLEMTGLDPDVDTILEASVIITDNQFNHVAQLGPIIIHHTKEQLSKMNDWCKQHHKASGLTQEALDATLTLKQAESQLLNFIKKYTQPQSSPLCGNSIWQDRSFVRKYMPRVNDYLHYRVIDVSTIKELIQRKHGEQAIPKKKETHRSLDDIKESIEEMKYYTIHYLK
ncbi:oligoribonuclease [Candidatus Woesearchaeota archaeon]|nr:oligoribonuclease [Candidatus Woesearchaeota archaeon]